MGRVVPVVMSCPRRFRLFIEGKSVHMKALALRTYEASALSGVCVFPLPFICDQEEERTRGVPCLQLVAVRICFDVVSSSACLLKHFTTRERLCGAANLRGRKWLADPGEVLRFVSQMWDDENAAASKYVKKVGQEDADKHRERFFQETRQHARPCQCLPY